MNETRQRPLVGIVAAVIAVALATAVRAAADPLVGDRIPFAPFFVAVAAVALYSGLGATLVVAVLSAVVVNYLFVPPRYEFIFFAPADMLATLLFVIASLAIGVVGARFHSARQRLAEAVTTSEKHTRQLQLERERLQELIASIPGVVWEAWGEPDSSRQRINYVSPFVESMLGYTQEEWRAQPNFWLQLVHPDDRDAARQVAAEKFANGGAGENEFRWVARDGRILWVLARSSTIRDDSGQPIGMRGVTFDITRRKEIELRLAVLAEISTTGLATMPFEELALKIARRTADVVGEYCIIRLYREGRLESVAAAHSVPEAEPLVREIASHSDIVALNSLYASLVSAPRTIVDNDLSEEAFAHVRREGQEDVFKKYRARRGLFVPLISNGVLLGTLAVGRASGAPFTQADAQFAEAIAARAALAHENARLMAAAQHDAEQARLARAQAEDAGRVKDEFLATLSHELRTPLNAILGWAHLLRDPQFPAERRQAAIDTILRNAQSQEQLISDILDVQRIMAGKIRLTLRSVDVGLVIRTAAETVQPSADAKQIRLQLLLDPDAPAVTGDSERLQQIVWNLLSNAIKFAPPGGHVQVRLLRAGDFLELTVEDDGPGIDPAFIPHMFERFRQADSSTTRTHKGLGLGLAIVRTLVEMHGGTIAAENRTGNGVTGALFTIRLPRQAAQAASPALSNVTVSAGDAPSLAGIHVLIVEDDHDARELLQAILERCGATVSVSSSVADGVRAFEMSRPDVIVSDIEMPDEDGYSFIRRIRSREAGAGRDVPAAALTAYASAADRMKVIAAGFNIHLSKPVQPAELALVISSLARRRH